MGSPPPHWFSANRVLTISGGRAWARGLDASARPF
jgi:hypothetical protein